MTSSICGVIVIIIIVIRSRRCRRITFCRFVGDRQGTELALSLPIRRHRRARGPVGSLLVRQEQLGFLPTEDVPRLERPPAVGAGGRRRGRRPLVEPLPAADGRERVYTTEPNQTLNRTEQNISSAPLWTNLKLTKISDSIHHEGARTNVLRQNITDKMAWG